jgi:UPF0755 protein
MPTERHRSAAQNRRRRRSNAAVSFLFLIIVAAALATAGVLLALRLGGGLAAVAPLSACAPDLSLPECAGLSAYLTVRGSNLTGPAGDEATPVTFSVQPGETAADVSARLAALGVVRDGSLLRLYMRYHGLDSQIEAGDFTVSGNMSLPEIARALGDASARETILTIPEGWRLEQVADFLESRTDITFGRDQFLGLTTTAARVPGNYTFLGDLPPGVSFEGFLFPDTYRLGKQAGAADLVGRMLENFESRVTPDLRQGMVAQGLTLYQALTLASIVEREAIVDDERPLIAGVFLNRLGLGMKLDADPTVQYALGFSSEQQTWWKTGLTLEDLAVDSPYNTYVYPGLPPGPIASPGLDSIMAVVHPQASDYLYFRAACDGSGRHVFALTLEEQVANACP